MFLSGREKSRFFYLFDALEEVITWILGNVTFSHNLRLNVTQPSSSRRQVNQVHSSG